MQNEVTGDMLLEFLADTIKGVPVSHAGWTNPNPAAAFSAKSVNVPGISECDEFKVKWRLTGSGSDYGGVNTFKAGQNGNIVGESYSSNKYWTQIRSFTVSGDTVAFGDNYAIAHGDSTLNTDNTCMVPLEIEPIKYVGGAIN